MVRLSLALCASTLAWAALSAKSPNILFILADDLGVGDVGVYPNPTKRARIATPNLNRLAAEGMVFTDAYAGYSVCAPSRMTLMSGFHGGHLLQHGDGMFVQLNENVSTVADMLKGAGYSTALIGKWGLDGNFQKPRAPAAGFPTLHGFDWFYGQSDQWQCHDYYPPFMFNKSENLSVVANVGASKAKCGHDFENCIWSAELWTEDAISYIINKGASRRPAGKPFFLYLAYTSPHAGSVGNVGEDDVPGPGTSRSIYANTSWPSVEKNFANTVTLVDAAIGRVLRSLDQAGETEDTVVFFASDNGAHQEGGHEYQFFNSSGYLHGFKRSIHDGGHRSPLIIRWPGVTPAGTISQQQWCFYDFLPTAAAIAGISDEDLPPSLDGYSLLPTLQGKTQDQPEFVYHDFPNCNDAVVKTMGLSCSFGQNVRMGNWSGVCVGGARPCTGRGSQGHFFLYDMASDTSQLNDVSSDHPDVVSAILKIMHEQYQPAWPDALLALPQLREL